MKILNQTRKTIIAEEVLIPKSLLDQSFGLLRYKTPHSMLLRTHFGIHTFGMYYPIDILILDNQNRVVAIKEDLKPNRVFLWNIKYETILELPSKTIEKTRTEMNDKILL